MPDPEPPALPPTAQFVAAVGDVAGANSAELLPPVPVAEGLPRETLVRVFPAADPSRPVPASVGGLYRARMRHEGALKVGAFTVAGIALIAWGVLTIMDGHWFGAVLAVAGLALALFVPIRVYSIASNQFFDIYAHARGLRHAKHGNMPAGVPLFSRGDEREWPHVLNGPLLGQDACMGHYTWTDVTHDSDGNRQEHDHPFTVVSVALPPAVAARYAGVFVAPDGIGMFEKVRDAFTSTREVQLESEQFTRRYSLRVAKSQDDVALYELFSTPFLGRLASDVTVFWEQQGAQLVCWNKGHSTDANELDRLVARTEIVLARYLEEWR